MERAEDVLTHKRLLQLAEDPANRPAFDVRPVQVNMFTFTRLSFFAFFLMNKPQCDWKHDIHDS